ncbi:MAG: MarP family serine protease [Mycobacteriales bacterium]|nr:MAG: colicin V production protein [Pseudonocardiales bacterium]
MIDILIVVLLVGYAVGGYRSGLIASVASFVGFFGGAVLGSVLAGRYAGDIGGSATHVVAAIAIVFAVAIAGQVVAVYVGTALRRTITWRPARAVDSALGALVSAITVLLVAWMLAAPLAVSPYPALASAVRHSRIVRAVDGNLPQPVRSLYASARDVIDRGQFTDVFGGLVPTRVHPVAPPDSALSGDPAAARAAHSVVKVIGVAPSCSRSIEGSGFVLAPHRVLTNAHVVAGVPDPVVVVNGDSEPATVVLYDPHTDVAVLDVAHLAAPPLTFSTRIGGSGDNAVIVGFPENGPLSVGAARIRGREHVTGPDIYHDDTVTREVYALRADVRPGNSGGPLLRPDGTVYGVVFAAALDQRDTGFALTAAQVSADVTRGRAATAEVSTQGCD